MLSFSPPLLPLPDFFFFYDDPASTHLNFFHRELPFIYFADGLISFLSDFASCYSPYYFFLLLLLGFASPLFSFSAVRGLS